jgi:hypothetical protein
MMSSSVVFSSNSPEQGTNRPINLEGVSDKHLQTMERLARELLAVMRQAKLKDEPLVEALQQLELQAGIVRRERFDSANPQYRGY